MARLSQLSRSVAGHRVIVTGAASGMGRATARLFADEGARVVATDRDGDRLAEVVREIVEAHGPDSALAVTADVASPPDLVRLVDEAVQWLGGLDVVVNNAGVVLENSPYQSEAEFEENWELSHAVNVTAQIRLVRLALDHLLESPAGRIVNISSTESIVTTSGITGYSSSKAAVVGLTRSLAVELGRTGVTSNCICPGPIDTAMTANFDSDTKDLYARRRVPMRRYGIPEEVAQMTLNLCLPASSYVNGAIIPVDGGMTVRHT